MLQNLVSKIILVDLSIGRSRMVITNVVGPPTMALSIVSGHIVGLRGTRDEWE